MSDKPSTYKLTPQQAAKFKNVSEIQISIWGTVPLALDRLVQCGLFGGTRAEVYYRLAMQRLEQLESEKNFIEPIKWWEW